MKRRSFGRLLSLALALVMTLGLFSVCGFGVLAEGEEETKALTLRTWNPTELEAAAAATGVTNSHGYPIYTVSQEIIGRRSIDPSNYMLHDAPVPRDGYTQDTSLLLVVRLLADDTFTEGVLCQYEALYDVANNADTYNNIGQVKYDDYISMETQYDEQYGYEYKEFNYLFTLEDDIYADTTKSMQLRCKGMIPDVSFNLYYIALLNADDDSVICEFSGNQFSGLPGIAGTYENIVSDGANIQGIVSYSGVDENKHVGRGEPYSLYNSDGLYTEVENEDGEMERKYAATLMDSLGMELDAGDYAFDFYMASVYSLGPDRVTYYAMDGDTELAMLYVDYEMVDETVGKDSGTYETRRLSFTVPEESAGHEITFKIVVHNSTDYFLKNVSLNLIVPADAQAPEDAQKVIDMINALDDITDTEAITAARTAYDALDTTGKAWVGADLLAKLESYEQAQTSAQAIIDAITALGDASAVNKDNYTQFTEALEGAESQYNAFVAEYGEENAAALITNAQALVNFRTAYDAAKKEAEEEEAAAKRQAAIDNVESLIEAIGEVTEDNYAEKKEPIEAAEAALATLRSDYGNEIDSEVSNLAALTDARAKYNELMAEPDVTYGDINDDGNIDASDALEALQHSVELKTLEGDALTAADVTNDGTVDAADALNILQYSVELIDHFPVEE